MEKWWKRVDRPFEPQGLAAKWLGDGYSQGGTGLTLGGKTNADG